MRKLSLVLVLVLVLAGCANTPKIKYTDEYRLYIEKNKNEKHVNCIPDCVPYGNYCTKNCFCTADYGLAHTKNDDFLLKI